jgi:hypothetical protein
VVVEVVITPAQVLADPEVAAVGPMRGLLVQAVRGILVGLEMDQVHHNIQLVVAVALVQQAQQIQV